MVDTAALRCAVAYALPHHQHIVELTLPIGATAQDALLESGLLELYPELRAQQPLMGIFGKQVRSDQALSDGDRVEIYRPLAADPRAARRARAKR